MMLQCRRRRSWSSSKTSKDGDWTSNASSTASTSCAGRRYSLHLHGYLESSTHRRYKMNNQPNRKQRRVEESRGRKVVIPQGELNALKAELAGLKAANEQMRKAFNHNHQVYAGAIHHLDGHLAVLRAVINDVHMCAATGGRVRPQALEDLSIHWALYYDQYNAFIQQERDKELASAKEAGTLISAADAEELVFGGDVPPRKEDDHDQERTSGSGEVPSRLEEPASAQAAG